MRTDFIFTVTGSAWFVVFAVLLMSAAVVSAQGVNMAYEDEPVHLDGVGGGAGKGGSIGMGRTGCGQNPMTEVMMVAKRTGR